MIKIVRAILFLGAVLLIVYPLWGVLYPESYSAELVEHHQFSTGFSHSQVSAAASYLWLPNLAMAISYLLLYQYFGGSDRAKYAYFAGAALIAYPFLRTVAEILIAQRMTEHAIGSSLVIQFSSEKMFFILYGLIIIGFAAHAATHNNGFEQPPKSGAV